MNRISRLAAVALLTSATAVTAGAQSASAGTTDWKWCDGAQVETCVELELDGGQVRAVGTATDVAGGTDFGVDVRWVKLQAFNRVTREWNDWAVTTEEGFETHFDVAATGWRSCAGHGGNMTFRAGGWYKWRVAPDGAPQYDQMWTDPHAIPCTP